jgi:opacity protein-like surface antigen
MKYAIFIFVIMVVAVTQLAAQQDQPRDDRTTIVIQQDQPEKQNYYSIRAGVWFPKDWEKGFKFKDVSINEAEGDIDQSQALGLDFHYRRNLGRPVYVDLAVSGWYSSYTYKLRSTSIPTAEKILNADSWVVIVPVTLGLSIAPLPDNPFQPYAMVGGGAYFGLTGRSLQISERNELNEDDSHIRFGWYFGLGLDFFLTSEFGISAAAKYQNLEFEEELFTGQKDFTGIQAQLGIVLKM